MCAWLVVRALDPADVARIAGGLQHTPSGLFGRHVQLKERERARAFPSFLLLNLKREIAFSLLLSRCSFPSANEVSRERFYLEITAEARATSNEIKREAAWRVEDGDRCKKMRKSTGGEKRQRSARRQGSESAAAAGHYLQTTRQMNIDIFVLFSALSGNKANPIEREKEIEMGFPLR